MLEHLIPAQAERFAHPHNDYFFEVILSRNDDGAFEPRLGHDVVIATLPVESATLVFANLDEFLPLNRAHAQLLLAAERLCKRG